MNKKNTQPPADLTETDNISDAISLYNQAGRGNKRAAQIGLVAATVTIGYAHIQMGNPRAAAEAATEVEGLLEKMDDLGRGPFGIKVRAYIQEIRAGGLSFMIESDKYFEEFV
jgi:hypothetical protein